MSPRTAPAGAVPAGLVRDIRAGRDLRSGRDSESGHGVSASPARGEPIRGEAGSGLRSLLRRPALVSVCANPGCNSGWLRLWRSRSTPVFEGGWTCSPQCTRAQVEAALARELAGRSSAPEMHRHRVPLGLGMLEQGWITADQLRRALLRQREAGAGRIGQWLRREGVEDALIARALAVQWSCPVFSAAERVPDALTALVPRLFVDAFGALPLRVAAEKVLYLGFEDRLDPALALAMERMSGLRVECGLVEESGFRRAQARALEARYPAVELVEAASEAALAGAIAKTLERTRPLAAKLVRVHDCVWLRMWLRAGGGVVPALAAVSDLIGSLRS